MGLLVTLGMTVAAVLLAMPLLLAPIPRVRAGEPDLSPGA